MIVGFEVEDSIYLRRMSFYSIPIVIEIQTSRSAQTTFRWNDLIIPSRTAINDSSAQYSVVW